MKAIKHNFSAKKISLIYIVHRSGAAIASITFELVKILRELGANWSLVKRRAIKTRPSLSLSLPRSPLLLKYLQKFILVFWHAQRQKEVV